MVSLNSRNLLLIFIRLIALVFLNTGPFAMAGSTTPLPSLPDKALQCGESLKITKKPASPLVLTMRINSQGRPSIHGLLPEVLQIEELKIKTADHAHRSFAFQLENSHDNQELKKRYALKNVSTPIYSNNFPIPLVAKFGVRYQEWGSTNRPTITRHFLNLISDAAEADMPLMTRRSHPIPSPFRHWDNHSWNAVRHIAPEMTSAHSNTTLSLEVLTKDHFGKEVRLSSLVLDHVPDARLNGYRYDFKGATLGTGQEGANGKILISPRLVKKAYTLPGQEVGPRQIFILNPLLEIEETIPVTTTAHLSDILYLSMDHSFIYAFGNTATMAHQLILIERDSHRPVLAIEIPLSPFDSEDVATDGSTHSHLFTDQFIQESIPLESELENKGGLKITQAEIENKVIYFMGLNPWGHSQKYALDLRTLLAALNGLHWL